MKWMRVTTDRVVDYTMQTPPTAGSWRNYKMYAVDNFNNTPDYSLMLSVLSAVHFLMYFLFMYLNLNVTD